MIRLINDDCMDIMPTLTDKKIVVVTDPPFNIGYHYDKCKDNMPEYEYYHMIKNIMGGGATPSVIIHYPEAICRLSIELQIAPQRVVSWVYNSNTARQHRDIAFYGVKPNFNQVKQPYKNPNDKRIRQRIASGKTGCKLYDWWNVNQVKNVSKDKTSHPCQMPIEVMENIIGVLPRDSIIVDPFMGSGTTGLACKKYNMDFIGIEYDEKYFEIAKKRLIDIY